VPKKFRGLTGTEKFMTQLRTDKKEDTDMLRVMSTEKRQEEKEKTRKFLQKQVAKIREEDLSSEENGMEVEEDTEYKSKKLSKEDKQKLEKEEEMKKSIAKRMLIKIQKKFNKRGLINDTDRKIGSKLPVHLNTGKRGIGKTDRR